MLLQCLTSTEVSDGHLQKLHGNNDAASQLGQYHEKQSPELGRGKLGGGDSLCSPRELAQGQEHR